MIDEKLLDALKVDYVKVEFKLTVKEKSTWPRNKTSAFRGGIGEMLLKRYCIGNSKCENCSFEPECMVRRLMYAKYDIRPDFITSGESIGYIWNCDNVEENLDAGDEVSVKLTLLGKCIMHLPEYIDAMLQLGNAGLGKNHGRFEVSEISDDNGKVIFEFTESKNKYEYRKPSIRKLSEYVENRLKELESGANDGEDEINIQLLSPMQLKHNGEFIKKFDETVFFRAIARRLYMVNCFCGLETGLYDPEMLAPFETISQDVGRETIERYSERTDQRIKLTGITGNASIRMKTPKMKRYTLCMLLAGEVIHIGKNVSIGFGRYRLGGK